MARTSVRYAFKWVDLLATFAAAGFLLALHWLGQGLLEARTAWWACLGLVLAASAAKAAAILLPRPNLRRRPVGLRLHPSLREPRIHRSFERWDIEPTAPLTTSIAPIEPGIGRASLARAGETRRSSPLRADWQLIEQSVPFSLNEGTR